MGERRSTYLSMYECDAVLLRLKAGLHRLRLCKPMASLMESAIRWIPFRHDPMLNSILVAYLPYSFHTYTDS